MRGWLKVLVVGVAGVALAIGGLHKSAFAADGQKETALAAATKALNADGIATIEYSGAGKWHLFGQSRNPSAPDPEYDLASYTATINYATATKHVVMIRDPAMIVRV
ncbi:MAG: hypothetical protein ABUS57_22145, partial [Pseudomonadota bacterium]